MPSRARTPSCRRVVAEVQHPAQPQQQWVTSGTPPAPPPPPQLCPRVCSSVHRVTPIVIAIAVPHLAMPPPVSTLRAACLQNETAPKSFNFKTKTGPKNYPKLPRKILSLVLLCRIFHRHYSKIFHREVPHKIKYFFTTRICRHGHANNTLAKQRRH